MKQTFGYAVLSIVIGNILITIGEYTFISAKELDAMLQRIINEANYNNMHSVYTPAILFKKIMIWFTTCTVLAVLMKLLPKQNSKRLRIIVKSFYCIAILVNLIIVPHPAWCIVVGMASVIVPFYIVEELLQLYKLYRSKAYTTYTPGQYNAV